MGRAVNKADLDEYGCDRRQQIMISHYLRDPLRIMWKAYAAAYRDGGERDVCTQGMRAAAHYQFRKPAVRAAIAAQSKKLAKRFELEREKVVRSVAETAFLNLAEMFDEDGNPIPLHLLPEHVASAVQSFELDMRETEDGRLVPGTYKVKLVDKGRSRDSLARMLNLFEADNRSKTEPLSELLGDIIRQASGRSRGLPGDDERNITPPQDLLERKLNG